jgi:hypothetical protein
MKYIANPVEVDAFRIISVHAALSDGRVPLNVEEYGSERLYATPEMCARMKPYPGDYWVVQSDGYIYLNPKDVFERKYHEKLMEVEAAPGSAS